MQKCTHPEKEKPISPIALLWGGGGGGFVTVDTFTAERYSPHEMTYYYKTKLPGST